MRPAIVMSTATLTMKMGNVRTTWSLLPFLDDLEQGTV